MALSETWQNELKSIANPDKAKILSSFFKTGKGEYGEGDIFIGITVPQNRKIAKKFINASFADIETLLTSPIHEFRLSALIALVLRFKKHKDDVSRSEIVNFYLAHTRHINNWDLVDLSCPYILGEWTRTHSHDILFTLAQSSNMWEQRIAIVSTLTLVRNDIFDTTITLAESFLTHTHDLMHKATGWLLREVGKRDIDTLLHFLNTQAHRMPRTTLRYSIEKLPQPTRLQYLSIKKTKNPFFSLSLHV